MAGVDGATKDVSANPFHQGPEFHLINLVPKDCCHNHGANLEAKLERLEDSLNDWLREKIAEVESGKLVLKCLEGQVERATSKRQPGGGESGEYR